MALGDAAETISEYLLKTMRVNFDYIDKYPHYVFNWTGSNRYRMMKEYFPDDYARLTQYVAAGRWFPLYPAKAGRRPPLCHPERSRGICSAPFSQTKPPASERAALV